MKKGFSKKKADFPVENNKVEQSYQKPVFPVEINKLEQSYQKPVFPVENNIVEQSFQKPVFPVEQSSEYLEPEAKNDAFRKAPRFQMPKKESKTLPAQRPKDFDAKVLFPKPANTSFKFSSLFIDHNERELNYDRLISIISVSLF